jgi:hypothetical protein
VPNPVIAVSSKPAVQRARRRLKWARIHARYRAHQRLLANRASARRFAADRPVLDPVQRRVVDDLERDGIALVPFAELVGDDALWRALTDDIGTFAEQAALEGPGEGASKDAYLIRRLRRLTKERKKQGIRPASPAFAPDDPWIRLATSAQVLGVANAYRGMWTKLVDLDHWYTVPRGEQDRTGSQRWHRDPEDQHVLKAFVYFNDIDDDAGPFQYIAGSAEGRRYGDLWPWSVGGETYPPQDELARAVTESDYVTARGPAGTIIFCDTSGFHRGGFARSRPRLMSYLTYTSPAALASYRETRSFRVEPAPGADSLPPAAHFALT